MAVAGGTSANKRTRGRGRAANLPRLLAGPLCLEFANTIEAPISAEPEDFLGDYASLVRWSWHARAIDDGQLTKLTALVEATPERARGVFAQTLRLRRAVDHVFRALAAGRAPGADDLQTIAEQYREGLAAALLVSDGQRFSWSYRGVNDLRLPLWLVAASAVELLTEGELARVKQCPGADDCGWLFYDSSRNGTRRWCSMEGCGSRVKMRRNYTKSRKAHSRREDDRGRRR
jgi:predicted RNA-binding Zn ribbon-like protein